MSKIPPVVVCLCAAAAVAHAADVRSAGRNPIPGSYIVVLQDDSARSPGEAPIAPTVAEVAQDMQFLYGARTTFVYDQALKGFAAHMSAEQAKDLAGELRAPHVGEAHGTEGGAPHPARPHAGLRPPRRAHPAPDPDVRLRRQGGVRERLHHRLRHPREPL